ncbi:hypothetical protein FQ377_14580 [Arthrobacter echini]|uniref:Uncharacterized protein n=1 Tax=Arthrobacter echini TaxID=1529066 RepID=A0A5D0XHF6_9MICC|nr:hypothetical protein [Arthrobacter echini]TYC95863.1 hypothetical protein FQ377_14580 [Arthrobacter echini]
MYVSYHHPLPYQANSAFAVVVSFMAYSVIRDSNFLSVYVGQRPTLVNKSRGGERNGVRFWAVIFAGAKTWGTGIPALLT